MNEYIGIIKGVIANLKDTGNIVIVERMSRDMMIGLGAIVGIMSLIIIMTLFFNTKKHPILKIVSILLKLTAFAMFFATPILLKMYMGTVKPNENKIEISKNLTYLNSILIKGSIKNTSDKKTYKGCIVTAKVKKTSSNQYKKYIYELITLRTATDEIKNIAPQEKKEFRITVDNFKYKGRIITKVESDCY